MTVEGTHSNSEVTHVNGLLNVTIIVDKLVSTVAAETVQYACKC
jgi:hypothetical protein